MSADHERPFAAAGADENGLVDLAELGHPERVVVLGACWTPQVFDVDPSLGRPTLTLRGGVVTEFVVTVDGLHPPVPVEISFDSSPLWLRHLDKRLAGRLSQNLGTPNMRRTFRTDAHGRYSMTSRASSQTTRVRCGPGLRFDGGQRGYDVIEFGGRVELRTTASVSARGCAVGADGRPVDGTVVTLVGSSSDDSTPPRILVSGATAPNGEFLIWMPWGWLDARRGMLDASPELSLQFWDGSGRASVVELGPLRREAAESHELGTLVIDDAVPLTVRLVDEDGAPVEGARLEYLSTYRSGPSGGDGVVQLDGLRAPLEGIAATCEGYCDERVVVPVAAPERLTVVLERETEVEIVVPEDLVSDPRYVKFYVELECSHPNAERIVTNRRGRGFDVRLEGGVRVGDLEFEPHVRGLRASFHVRPHSRHVRLFVPSRDVVARVLLIDGSHCALDWIEPQRATNDRSLRFDARREEPLRDFIIAPDEGTFRFDEGPNRDFRLPLSAFTRLAGPTAMLLADDRPRDYRPFGWNCASSSTYGEFRFVGIPSGTYTLRLHPLYGRSEDGSFREYPIVVDGASQEIRIGPER